MMQAVIQPTIISFPVAKNPDAFGQKIGLTGLLFGCWHPNLSRPFGIGRKSYIVCLDCGARKHFDPETLTTFGSFHFPPVDLSAN